MANEEQRIALFIDFENLAIGAQERGEQLNVGVIMDALSERGRVVARRAYADWNLFSEHRQNLVNQRIEMIEVPQRTGTVRKNAADIKLAVDALEMAFERDFITTFVVASGDSDFTPLVLKLRELNKRVIGVGVEGSTSKLLPGACDEFLYYERLLGAGSVRTPSGRGRRGESRGGGDGSDGPEPADLGEATRRITATLAGLQRSMDGSILSSMLKRAMLRKDPAFSEGDLGFRTWGEFMRHLQSEGVVELEPSGADGDPTVDFPSNGGRVTQAFDLLKEVVNDLEGEAPPPLSSLKNELRRRKQGFSERDYGYGGFLQFVKAAQAKDLVDMQWSEEAEDYLVTSKEAKRTSTRRSSSATDDAADTEASPAKSTARKSTRKSTARKSTRKSTVRKSTAASGSRKSSAAKRGSSKSTSRRRTSDD